MVGMGHMGGISRRDGEVLFLDPGGSLEGFHFVINNSAVNLCNFLSILFYNKKILRMKQGRETKGEKRRRKRRSRGRGREAEREGGRKREREEQSPLKYRWKKTVCLLPNKVLGGSKSI